MSRLNPQKPIRKRSYQDRAIIRTRAALYALDMLRRMALGLDVPESIPFTPQTPNSDLDI